jgi:alkylated DNA repair dioxygenase AlkB
MEPTKSYSSIINNIDVHYYNNFLDKDTAYRYFNILEQNVIYTSDEESKVTVYGKKHVIPRKQVAFGDFGTSYNFAGVTVAANPWTNVDDILCKTLLEIKNKVEEYTGKKFNFVLINRYKDGESYIGAHRDDEKELGDDPSIACVTFGAERPIVFAPYRFIPLPEPNNINLPLVNDKLSVILEHGSLCVMLNKTNTFWTHMIPKRSKIKTPRVSLTFRLIQ